MTRVQKVGYWLGDSTHTDRRHRTQRAKFSMYYDHSVFHRRNAYGRLLPRVEFAMRATRRDAVRSIATFMDSPQSCANARELVFDNEWQRMFPVHSVSNPPSPLTVSIFEPLYVAIEAVINRTPRVTHLRFSNLGITSDMFSCMSVHPSVRSLSLECCFPVMPRLDGLTFYAEATLYNVTYLALGFGLQSQTYVPMWLVISMCPQLRWLYAYTAANGITLCYPMPVVQRTIPYIHTVEHMHFQGTTSFVSGLVQWMMTAAQSLHVPSRLVKLKIHAVAGMFEEDVEWLIDTLAGYHPRTRVLVLEGLEVSSPSLMHRIALALPDLESLTLMRRASESQRCNRLCTWPDPIHEYAEQLRALRKLRHFEANFQWSPYTYSPSSIRQFATLDDPTASAMHAHRLESIEGDDDSADEWLAQDPDLMDDGLSVAMPFANACQKLESFAVRADSIAFSCRIRRDCHGSYVFFDVRNYEQECGFENWNPRGSETWATNI